MTLLRLLEVLPLVLLLSSRRHLLWLASPTEVSLPLRHFLHPLDQTCTISDTFARQSQPPRPHRPAPLICTYTSILDRLYDTPRSRARQSPLHWFLDSPTFSPLRLLRPKKYNKGEGARVYSALWLHQTFPMRFRCQITHPLEFLFLNLFSLPTPHRRMDTVPLFLSHSYSTMILGFPHIHVDLQSSHQSIVFSLRSCRHTGVFFSSLSTIHLSPHPSNRRFLQQSIFPLQQSLLLF